MPAAILQSLRLFRHAALLLVLTTGVAIQGAQAQGNSCPPLTDTQKAKIVAYISKWMAVPETENLEIEGDELVPGTCYRKLAVKGRTLLPRPFFLSPDQRFLSGSLLDVTMDPSQERKQAQEGINKVLLTEPSPSRGLPTASVTVVEFGDFECLFCKRFHEWVQSLSAERVDFRVVFKHLPLQGHPWAHDAAAFAACAEVQSGDAFWRLHDFFYANQATLTAENLESRVTQDLVNSAVDSSRLLNCVHSHQADVRIDRDIRLANQFGIKATPTVFVNGARGGDLRTIEQLRDAIRANVFANPRPVEGTKSTNR